MGIGFLQKIFKSRRPQAVPETESVPTESREVSEAPKTPWQTLVAGELTSGNITQQDVELLHDVELPEILNYDSIVANLKKKATGGRMSPKIGPERIERNRAFGEFLLKKFDKRTFKIQEQNGLFDQAIDEKGNVVTHPALLFSVGKSEIPVHFGLECKWVAHMSEHGLICSGKSVLARAKVFERETRIPVFMIVAVAGLPDAPEHLYVIPVRELFSNYVVADRLMFYEKDVDEPFRFDRQNLKLY